MRGCLSSRLACCLLFLVCVCAILILPAFAQKITGDIEGNITDSSGAVVPNVTVTVENTGTGLSRTATTSASGNFRVPDLPVGMYKIRATAPGFKTVVTSGEVKTAAVMRADFTLQVGQRTETVEVEGTAPLIDLSPNNNSYVDNAKIENVPLNGRDFNSLIAM